MKIHVKSVNASLFFNRITLILYLHAFSNDLTYRLECTFNLETCLKMEIHVIALCTYAYGSHEIGIIFLIFQHF